MRTWFMRYSVMSFVIALLMGSFAQAGENNKEEEQKFEQMLTSLQRGREVAQEGPKLNDLILRVAKGKSLTDDDKLFLTLIDSKYDVDKKRQLMSVLMKKEMDLEGQGILLVFLEQILQRQKVIIEKHCELLEQLQKDVKSSKSPPMWVWWYIGEAEHYQDMKKIFVDFQKALQDSIKKLQE